MITSTFARSIARYKVFAQLNRSTVLASALEVGWMDYFGKSDDIPLTERFYAGGPGSLRGFRYQRVGPVDDDGEPLGGRFSIVWNALELRRAIYKMVGAVAFLDVGNVWRDIADAGIDDVRLDVGTGIRLATPIGIVRVDYGVNLDRRNDEPRSQVYFSMGHAF